LEIGRSIVEGSEGIKKYYAYNKDSKPKVLNGFYIEYKEGVYILMGYFKDNKKHGVFTEYRIQET